MKDRSGACAGRARGAGEPCRGTATMLFLILSVASALTACRPPVQADAAEASMPAPEATAVLAREAGGGFGSREAAERTPGVTYTNVRVANVPWSIHVVAVDRSVPGLVVRSAHAGGAAVGLGTLSGQLAYAAGPTGKPVAAVNGDFYQRDSTFAGDPRGLQIVNGEVLSAPTGGVAFWVDTNGVPSTGPVRSKFEVTWPGGQRMGFGLNEERSSDELLLYTASVGASTRSPGGREYILEAAPGGGPWLPLRMGMTYAARVREIREGGNSRLSPEVMVLSAGPALARNLSGVSVGAVLQVSLGSEPELKGVPQAIGGGPVLVRGGQRQRIVPSGDGYSSSSMFERHPRSAVAWNDKYLYLVEVDGRQRGLSVGMTLEEFATWLVKLGCREAMNLDGGGSATFWYDGRIRNSPCDGHERAIANALVVVREATGGGGGTAAAQAAPAEALNGR